MGEAEFYKNKSNSTNTPRVEGAINSNPIPSMASQEPIMVKGFYAYSGYGNTPATKEQVNRAKPIINMGIPAFGKNRQFEFEGRSYLITHSRGGGDQKRISLYSDTRLLDEIVYTNGGYNGPYSSVRSSRAEALDDFRREMVRTITGIGLANRRR